MEAEALALEGLRKSHNVQPEVVSSSFVCLFARRSRGGELDPRRTTEKRRTIAPGTNPGHPRRGVGAQGAGAPLTGRSRRSNEKVKRVQMLLPTVGNSFNRCQFTSWVLRVQIQKPAGGVCVVRSGSGQKLYRKRTQWVANETQSLSPVS